MLRIWVKNPAVPVSQADSDLLKYGLLYNNYAVLDARLICADGWSIAHALGVGNPWYVLVNYLGADGTIGGFLKETDFIYWSSPNTSATNAVGFNLRGAGYRHGTTGVFTDLNQRATIALSDTGSFLGQYVIATYNSAGVTYGITRSLGVSIRPFRAATVGELLLPDGLISATYTGNDGKVYRCIKVGTQIWVSCNLAETKYRNGDWITGYDTGTYTPISNAAWAALTTEALCAYNNDLNNV